MIFDLASLAALEWVGLGSMVLWASTVCFRHLHPSVKVEYNRNNTKLAGLVEVRSALFFLSSADAEQTMLLSWRCTSILCVSLLPQFLTELPGHIRLHTSPLSLC